MSGVLFPETLQEARERLFKSLDEGIACPCCGQFAKRYRRNLSFSQVRSMVALYRVTLAHPELEWHHVKTFDTIKGGNVFCKARYWELVEWKVEIEEDADEDEQDKKHTGFWKLTPKGVDFLRGLTAIPKYVYVYNGAHECFDGPLVTVHDCLKASFSYAELMAGIPTDV